MRSRFFVRPLMTAVLTATLAMPSLVQAMPADQTATEEYGKSGDWTLRRTVANGSEVVSCDMYTLTGSEQGLRFAYDQSHGELGFSGVYSSAKETPMDVEMWFGADRSNSQVVSMTLETDGNGFQWRSYSASNAEPDGVLDDLVLNSPKVSFAYLVPGEGEHIESFSLKGYADASVKTTECINGANDTSAPAAEAAVAEPKVIKGTCKLVVDGKTYVDIKKTCAIWMANDGTGTFWINADRETYLGDYFAEIMPAGDGTASGHWNGEKGATHAQSFLGEDFKQGKGGCWKNKRATICAVK